MNTTSNFPTDQIRANAGCAANGTEMIKALKTAAKKLFESSEKVATMAVLALTISLVIVAGITFEESSIATSQYCEAIEKITFVP